MTESFHREKGERDSHESMDDPAVQELRAALHVAVPVEDAEIVDKRRDQLLAVIQREISQAPARRKNDERQQKLGRIFRALAAAAILVGTMGLGSLLSSESAVEGHAPLAAVSGKKVVASAKNPGSGALVQTQADQAKLLELPGETQVHVRPKSRVLLLDDSITRQVMRLESGGVLVSVPPAGVKAQRSVKVLTPHASVEVKGTQFSVDLLRIEGDSGSPTHQTRVSVKRGVVLVRHPDGVETLNAGDSWLSESTAVLSESTDVGEGSSSKTSKVSPKARPASNMAENPRLSPKTKGSASHKKAPHKKAASQAASSATQDNANTGSSTLAKQNALLEAALLAIDRGDHSRALTLTSDLLRQYPSSPLGASARSVRKRALSASKN